MRQYCQGAHEEKENTGIRCSEPREQICHPAHDDEQQQQAAASSSKQQQAAAAAATAE